MTRNQRKARKKALKKAQKERRKENAAPQPGTQPGNQTEHEGETVNKTRTRELLDKAVAAVEEVIDMTREALKAVDRSDANAVYAARLKAQARRDREQGVKTDEKTLLRAHPLYPIWRLQLRAGAQLEKLLAVSDPGFFAARKLELEAAKLRQEADKLTKKTAA